MTLLPPHGGAVPVTHGAFPEPIDALSVSLPTKDATAEVSGMLPDGSWTAWQTLGVDDEQDPALLESNLVLFSAPVKSIRIRGDMHAEALHPIRIAQDGIRYNVAALTGGGKPRVLTREQWGADETFLYVDGKPPAPATPEEPTGDQAPSPTPTSSAASVRQKQCEADQQAAPGDFKVQRTVRTEDGKTLRWARQYSGRVKVLAVHHTALMVSGDERSGVERMRALYAYHSNNRAWGDIGYHYVIDETGQIYEGKSGGDLVVGGHAYCNNVGTVGVALMGNFDEEKPTQSQMHSLQWLLGQLAERYDIDLDRQVTFHGRSVEPILGHRDLVSTDCPGFYAYGVLDQVRRNTEEGDFTAVLTFPKKPAPSAKTRSDGTADRKEQRLQRLPQKPAFTEGLSLVGGDALSGRAEAQLLFTLRYQAGAGGSKRGKEVGGIVRSRDDIGLWLEKDGAYMRLRGSIALPQPVPAEGQALLKMRVQLPKEEGTYALQIGNARLTLNVTGRSLQQKGQPSRQQTSTRSSASSVRAVTPRSRSSSSAYSRAGSSSPGAVLRIRLKSREAGLRTCRDADIAGLHESYRGSVSCVALDGLPMLINTLTLEEYLMGLSEEPDTEPFEKQRAFAVAARTYALYYADPDHRKFPGMPYDGSDSAAEFQKYSGKVFETENTRWLAAVSSTRGMVLTKDGEVIRAPYFSSNDGRTRSPDEAGWPNFPFKEVFASKPDPWCEGMENRGHGVGMSGCGAEGQAEDGKTAEEILRYYYPGTALERR